MPLVRFLGFPDGETVTIAASQDGASDEATLSNWNVVPTVQISVTRAPSAAQYAPEAVWFEAEATNFNTDPVPAGALVYDPAFHEIEYVWDFGDPGDTFAAPQNVPAEFKDANSAGGMIASHVFRQPGTYTVTCTARRVVDPDTMEVEEAVSSTTITIGDADTIWTADNTIVVAHDGDFSGAPPSNFQCTEWTEQSAGGDPWFWNSVNWLGVLNGAGGGPATDAPVRVLFKRGGDFTTDIAEGMSWSNFYQRQYSYIYYGGWGSGAKPISNRALCLGLAGRAMTWDGVEIRDTYDDVTESGNRETLVTISGGGYALLTECDLNRGGTGISLTNASVVAPLQLTVHDCVLEKIASYGLITTTRPVDYDGLGSRDRIAYLGCRDLDTGNAPHGRATGNGAGNSQGPIRSNGNEDLIVASSDLYSRYGWTGKGVWSDGVPATAEQPCLRVFSSGGSGGGVPNGRTVVSRCTGEGAEFFTVTSLFQDRPPFGNLLIDQVIHVGSASTNTFGVSEMGAITVRNFLGIKPNVPAAFGMSSLIYFANFPHDSAVTWDEDARLAEPIRMHNNSFILLREVDLEQGAFGLIDNFDTFTDANNVTYVPLSPAQPRHEDIAPFDSTELWDVRYLGRLEAEDGGVLQTQFAAPDGSASLYRPQPGSPVVGSTIGLAAYSDLLGTPRTTTQSRGAIEP
ncbi:MAG: PKD domain-containing protein [Pseudomonadota bacterium]